MPTESDDFYEPFKYGGRWPKEIPIHVSFPQFIRLPLELRLQIWALTRFHQRPRVIEVAPKSPNNTLHQKGPVGYPDIMSNYYSISPSASLFPPGFHVCREARQEAMGHFTWLPCAAWFDYERDYIYLGPFNDTRNMCEFINDARNFDRTKLRYLAIFEHATRVLKRCKKGATSELLCALKCFAIIFSDNGGQVGPGKREVGWEFGPSDYSYLTTGSIEDWETSELEKLEEHLKELKKKDTIENLECENLWALPETRIFDVYPLI